MTIHINRTVSEVYPIDGNEAPTDVETDVRLKQSVELRRLIKQSEAEQMRVAAWNFDD